MWANTISVCEKYFPMDRGGGAKPMADVIDFFTSYNPKLHVLKVS